MKLTKPAPRIPFDQSDRSRKELLSRAESHGRERMSRHARSLIIKSLEKRDSSRDSLCSILCRREVDGAGIKMSIRCVSIFRPSRSFNLLLRLASSARARARAAHSSENCTFQIGAPTRSRAPLSPCFFRCPGAPSRTGNALPPSPPKDNYNKSGLHNNAKHCAIT